MDLTGRNAEDRSTKEDGEIDIKEDFSEYSGTEDSVADTRVGNMAHVPMTCRECGECIEELVNRYLVCAACRSAATEQATHTFADVSEKILSCNICCFKCYGKEDLKNHMRIHQRNPFYCCTYSNCDYSCSDKLLLKRHVSTHVNKTEQNKPFSCPECGLKFSMRTYLRTHTRIHTGEKPYSCLKCSFICSQKSSLNRHVLTHSEVKVKRNILTQSSQKTVFKKHKSSIVRSSSNIQS